jgi:GT2 family glycosyltransferase
MIVAVQGRGTRPPPKVRVGIVSWNTAALLDRCLAALPAALGDLDAEVVVVDNASSDNSAAVADAHAHVTVIKNSENTGYSRAMNQALFEGAPVDVLVALNPDTEPPPRSLATLVERLVADPALGLVVPRLLHADGREQHSVYRFPSSLVSMVVSFVPAAMLRRGLGQRMWLEGFSDHRRRVDIDWAIGAVHVIRRHALAGKRPYDERWFMYGEDVELCARLRAAGWRLRLEGDIDVPHVGNVAGDQAWGTDRTARWLVPTYEFYEATHGPRAVRVWAAANVAGLDWLCLKWRFLARFRPARFGHLRGWAVEGERALAVHRRVLRGGVDSLRGLATGPPSPPEGRVTVIDPQ